MALSLGDRRTWFAPAPFEELCGIELVEAADGRAELRLPFRAELAQSMGLMHGGALAALADTALVMAVKTLVPEWTHFVTTGLELRFHAPVRGGAATALAEVRRLDARKFEGSARILDGSGSLAASCRSAFRIPREDPAARPRPEES